MLPFKGLPDFIIHYITRVQLQKGLTFVVVDWGYKHHCYCGAQQYFGPAPLIRWGPKAQAEEGYGPDTVTQVQHSIGIQPRTIQSSASPKSLRKKGYKWYRNNLGKNLKYMCQ